MMIGGSDLGVAIILSILKLGKKTDCLPVGIVGGSHSRVSHVIVSVTYLKVSRCLLYRVTP